MGLIASLSVDWAFGAVLFYLATYALASFGVFEVMAHVASKADAATAANEVEKAGVKAVVVKAK
jgi:hypothetical protein